MMVSRETFGPLSRYYPPVIGLTGLRGVGKSTAADHLVNAYGFRRIHPFAGGKVAAKAYFRHLCAIDDLTAERMVSGDLRDVAAEFLPGGVTPRYFLERFGKFMGADMGAEWTLGAEIERAWREEPGRPLVAESVVYEAPVIRACGGIIIRVVRPGSKGPVGVCTDDAQAALNVDATIVNDADIEKLKVAIDRVAQGVLGGR